MRSECIQSVTNAAQKLGLHDLTARDFQDIEGRIIEARKLIAQENRAAYQAMSPADQVRAAAERVARDIKADHERELRNIALQITSHDRNQTFIDRMADSGMPRVKALQRLIVNFLNNQGGVKSLEQVREGVSRMYKGYMEPIAKATEKLAGLADKNAVRDVIREIRGEDSGNATAKAMAKLWIDNIAEPLRKERNYAGANVGKLDYGYVPQSHSVYKIARDGMIKWMEFVLPRLDRERYVNVDGSLMNDTQMRSMLYDVHGTLSTDGAISQKTGYGTGGIKNRGSQHRVLHFNSADAHMDYAAQYGDRSFLESMLQHIETSARDIAAMRTFGPNAEAGFSALYDAAVQGDAKSGVLKAMTIIPGHSLPHQKNLTKTMFDLAAGKIGPAANPAVAHWFQNVRSWIAASRLGSAALSAFTDSANGIAIANSWRMPEFRAWGKWEAKSWLSAEHRQFMRSQGVGVEAIAHGLNRFGEETMGHGVPSLIANAVFRASGLNFMDNVRRIAAGSMLYSRIGELLDMHPSLAGADPRNVRQLVDAGTTEKMWQVWQKAERDPTYGLTLDAIRNIPDADLVGMGNPARLRRDAMQHLIGVVAREADTVVPMPTDKARATVEYGFGARKGTVPGELTRSVLQFKAFPIAMISNHWQRMMSMPTPVGKAIYAAELMATSTILGAVSVQLKSLVSGNNPQDMTNPKFVGRAVVQGGALGLYGDTLLNLWASPYKESFQDYLGPVVGDIADLFKIAGAAVGKAEGGKENVGGEVVRFLRGNTPGASLFYTKAILDHIIFQRMQDYFSPGYAQRMQDRTQRYYRSGQWWKPSTASTITAPQAPNPRAAIGAER